MMGTSFFKTKWDVPLQVTFDIFNGTFIRKQMLIYSYDKELFTIILTAVVAQWVRVFAREWGFKSQLRQT